MQNLQLKAESSRDIRKPVNSWPCTESEINPRERVTRSGKPDVVYHFSPSDNNQKHFIGQKAPSYETVVKQIVVEDNRIRSRVPSSESTVDDENPEDSGLLHLGGILRTPREVDRVFNYVHNFDLEDDVFQEQEIEETEDMATAEDTHIMPSHFSGEIHANDSDAWFRKFQNYCEYKGLTAAKALALFKVLMVGSAANWLETLGKNVRGDIHALQRAFNERY